MNETLYFLLIASLVFSTLLWMSFWYMETTQKILLKSQCNKKQEKVTKQQETRKSPSAAGNKKKSQCNREQEQFTLQQETRKVTRQQETREITRQQETRKSHKAAGNKKKTSQGNRSDGDRRCCTCTNLFCQKSLIKNFQNWCDTFFQTDNDSSK